MELNFSLAVSRSFLVVEPRPPSPPVPAGFCSLMSQNMTLPSIPTVTSWHDAWKHVFKYNPSLNK